MPKLRIRRDGAQAEIAFAGTPLLAETLAAEGFPPKLPCGGRGTCGKCAVRALTGDVSAPNAAETRAGARLACQARLLGDCEVTLPPEQVWTAIETNATEAALGSPMPGRWGAAVDLGTTTLVARVYDLQTGETLGEAATLNPQTAVAADVMGRISVALDGKLESLRDMAQTAVLGVVTEACAAANVPGADALTVAGNTTMLYLLTGRNPKTLAVSPFMPDCLFGMVEPIGGIPAYLPPCSGAFMGADLTCAALSAGFDGETVLLMDIGTNGELMLWHGGRLFAASASAGPVFEGGEISRGLGGVVGAIDKVWVENGGLGSRVIGGGKAEGICGSGIIDAVAALLRLGRIDKTGMADAPRLPIRDGVAITAADVRAVQLAKAAIAAGVQTLLSAAGITPRDVKQLILAGGFGSHLSVPSAAAIGLIPAALAGKAKAVGNASLAGAAALLLDTRLRERAARIAGQVELVPLGGSAAFEERFLAAMDFPG
ncbi:MAG: ASKHA domain-containing protein [Eubacteriales bacterium]|nr:ASKHA domain-containing protein [Eubacteriales bacterium]